MLIYKILLPDEWAAFEAAGTFDGSPLDHADGFVHCSSDSQVGDTVRRYFADAEEVVVVGLDTDVLGETVRWETFPHVYGPLTSDAIVEVHRLKVGR